MYQLCYPRSVSSGNSISRNGVGIPLLVLLATAVTWTLVRLRRLRRREYSMERVPSRPFRFGSACHTAADCHLRYALRLIYPHEAEAPTASPLYSTALDCFSKYLCPLNCRRAADLQPGHLAMTSSLPGNRDLPVSQFDLSTYWGRVQHSANISDPR